MAASLSRIYQLNASFTNEDWPNTLCEMHCNTQAKNFGRQWGTRVCVIIISFRINFKQHLTTAIPLFSGFKRCS